jgi:SAM-dependent methyltransferase
MNVFEQIYARDSWNGGSGPGSSPHNTVAYRSFLQAFLHENAIRSVLDVGCGDWQFSRLLDWSGINYIGIDVSPLAISMAHRNAATGTRFLCGDIRSLPPISADLALVKDVFQHLSWASIRQVMNCLDHCKKILVVNDIAERVCDIQDGDWRAVDIRQDPLNYKASLVFSFKSEPFDKHVMLVDEDEPGLNSPFHALSPSRTQD